MLIGVCPLSLSANNDQKVLQDCEIEIRTTPPGAVVYLDGEAQGRSPMTISGLEPGKHLITVKKDRFQEIRQTVTLSPGQKLPLDFALQPIKGYLLIHSTPSEADVEIDGAYMGRTPLLLTDVTLGEHRIKISSQGFAPREISLNVQDRTPILKDIELKSSAATLVVHSQPSGAKVLLNNLDKGQTPCTIDRVPEGSNILSLQLEGHKNYTETLTLQAGEENRVNVALETIPAELIIHSLPAKARIYFDNERVGIAPVTLKDLTPGSYRVRAEMQGYAPLARTITLEHGEKKAEEFRLERNTGAVKLTTIPAGVKVFIDGKPLGETKLDVSAEKNISAQLHVNLLKIGEHEITLKKERYQDMSFDIIIERGETTTIRKSLRRHFVKNYLVQTDTSTYTGMLVELMDNGGVKLEIRVGNVMTFPPDKIRIHRPLTNQD